MLVPPCYTEGDTWHPTRYGEVRDPSRPRLGIVVRTHRIGPCLLRRQPNSRYLASSGGSTTKLCLLGLTTQKLASARYFDPSRPPLLRRRMYIAPGLPDYGTGGVRIQTISVSVNTQSSSKGGRRLRLLADRSGQMHKSRVEPPKPADACNRCQVACAHTRNQDANSRSLIRPRCTNLPNPLGHRVSGSTPRSSLIGERRPQHPTRILLAPWC